MHLNRGYKAGFFWLPPMVSTPAYTGTVDAALSPTIEICRLDGDACTQPIVSFSGAECCDPQTYLRRSRESIP